MSAQPNPNACACITAGGSGEPFRPLSRRHTPERLIRSQWDWDAPGSWTALPAPVASEAHHGIAAASRRTIALRDFEHRIVVETADAVRVCRRNAVQGVKKLQPRLPEKLA
jgi:mannose-1-phosphate guanylyltransferase